MLIDKIKTRIRKWQAKPYANPKNKQLQEKFGDLKKCYILGSSPSINKFDLTKLDKGSMIISMGNFYEHEEIEKIQPSIHIFAASHPPITTKVLTDWWLRCEERLPKGTPVLVSEKDREVAINVFKNREVFTYAYGGGFPIDFTKTIIAPWSVSVLALQLGVYCKIDSIGLLGIDHDWQCIKPYRHFYDHSKPSLEYYLNNEGIKISYEEQKQPFPKERLYREYELYQQYESLKLYAEKNGMFIYNGDVYSNFDVFEKKPLQNIVKSD